VALLLPAAAETKTLLNLLSLGSGLSVRRAWFTQGDH